MEALDKELPALWALRQTLRDELPHTLIDQYQFGAPHIETVKSIEKAVESLPPFELAEFRRWFAGFDSDAWDRQLAQGVASGKLDGVAAEALADYRTGPVREL